MSLYGFAGGQIGRRLLQWSQTITPLMAPAGAWTAQGWWRFPPRITSLLTRIQVVLPAGVGGTLWVRPVYRDSGRDDSVYDLPLYAPGLNGYITGDELHLDMSVREQFTSRHELGVMVQNTGLLNHAYLVIYEVDIGGAIHG